MGRFYGSLKTFYFISSRFATYRFGFKMRLVSLLIIVFCFLDVGQISLNLPSGKRSLLYSDFPTGLHCKLFSHSYLRKFSTFSWFILVAPVTISSHFLLIWNIFLPVRPRHTGPKSSAFQFLPFLISRFKHTMANHALYCGPGHCSYIDRDMNETSVAPYVTRFYRYLVQ